MSENEIKVEVEVKKNPWFDSFKKNLTSLTDVQRSEIRDLLAIPKPTVIKRESNGVRVTGKVVRTEKDRAGIAMPKQMKILVDCLPKDVATGIEDWGKLAMAAGLETQQPAARIAAYYKKTIVDFGLAVVKE